MKNLKIRNKFLIYLLTGALTLSGCSITSSNYTQTETPTSSTTLDVERTNELTLFDDNTEITSITLTNEAYNNIINYINNENYEFSLSPYYGLEEALELYKQTETKKEKTSNILDSKGNIDATKLLNTVNENNKAAIKDGKNTLNSLYTEASSSKKSTLCNIIAEVINATTTIEERQYVANTLSNLTIFDHKGSLSNAEITGDITFIYSETMSDNYADTQNMINGIDKKTVIQALLTHEVIHLKQHKNNDLIKENGLEVGICRTYNDNEERIPVDSLWYSWLLEAAAELEAAEYTNTEPDSYLKNISYATSYNLSNFNQLYSENNKLEKIVNSYTLEEAYKKLNLTTSDSQLDFLKFMYSMEIIQMDPNSFWKNYTHKTGITLSENEKLDMRINLRCEIIKYLSKNFYTNLINSINDQKITDTDTMFYLMRVWEIDTYKHLEYSNSEYLDEAIPFIEWHNNVQTKIFEEIAKTSNTTVEALKQQYDEYKLQIKISETISENCNLNNIPEYAKNYIINTKNNYTTNGFIRNSDIVEYVHKK